MVEQCDCTCKYFESVQGKIKLFSNKFDEPQIIINLPICSKFSQSLAIIRCEWYEMK